MANLILRRIGPQSNIKYYATVGLDIGAAAATTTSYFSGNYFKGNQLKSSKFTGKQFKG